MKKNIFFHEDNSGAKNYSPKINLLLAEQACF